MSTTPRTDAAPKVFSYYSRVVDGEVRSIPVEHVTSDFARQLERELAARDATIEGLRKALEYYAGAPWAGHAGSWAHSNLAKRAQDALSQLPPPLARCRCTRIRRG